MLRIYLLGSLALLLVTFAAMLLLLLIGMLFFSAIGVNPNSLGNLLEQSLDGPAGTAGVAFSIFSYFFLMLVIGAFAEVFYVQPLLRHYVEELTILNPGELDLAVQRPHDTAAEAEGFADALDVGAAI